MGADDTRFQHPHTAVRHRAFRESLEERLAAESIRYGWSAHERVVWLAALVDEYLERWAGVREYSDWSAEELIESDLFAVLEIGASVLAREIGSAALSAETLAAWLAFLAALGELRIKADMKLAPTLIRSLENFRASVRSSI